jgi:hypothetical protein
MDAAAITVNRNAAAVFENFIRGRFADNMAEIK